MFKQVSSKIITVDFVAFLRAQFRLDWKGIHGISHWSRVRRNGLQIAQENDADAQVVEYFAFLHDAKRHYDGHDDNHGQRAADFAFTLRDSYIDLDDESFSLLITACQGHTHEQFHEDVTIQICWDADRLDLGRVGIMPDPLRMGTDKGKEMAYFFNRST
jgi:uncharacterized protein